MIFNERNVPGPRCTRPPSGWWCSRRAGHDGPCAARPIAPWWSRLLCFLGLHDWRDGPGAPCTVCGTPDTLFG